MTRKNNNQNHLRTKGPSLREAAMDESNWALPEHRTVGRSGRVEAAEAEIAPVDRLVNETIDLEAQEMYKEAAQLVALATERHPEFLTRLRETRAALAGLRVGLRTPDLSEFVLAETHTYRPFLGSGMRRRVNATRVAVVCAALALISMVAVMQRVYPHAEPAARLATSGEVGRASVAAPLGAVEVGARALPSMVLGDRLDAMASSARASSGANLNRRPARLSLGDTSAYEISPRWSMQTSVESGSGPAPVVAAAATDRSTPAAESVKETKRVIAAVPLMPARPIASVRLDPRELSMLRGLLPSGMWVPTLHCPLCGAGASASPSGCACAKPLDLVNPPK